jgi:NADH-quinone oxidoreductase subunit F
VVNNVETLCKVPAVIENGAQWFRSLGTPDSAGTRVFSLSGHVRRPGVFEVPSGCTLRDLVYDMGGGMAPGRRFNMALTGGAAGTLVPESHLDVPLEFSSHTKGVNVGSGAIIAFDESISAVDVLEWLLHFFQVESCGKCTPCRQGAFRAHHLLGRLAARDGRPSDLAELRRLSAMLRATSLCGLGKSIAWPIDSALEHFSDEFAARMAT